ncbi:MAG: YkgJ family cysteine cluster protein [Myxococcales bacterium]|nr:YkgJ family cysteine cluster protein [Myxococcales bacterium]
MRYDDDQLVEPFSELFQQTVEGARDSNPCMGCQAMCCWFVPIESGLIETADDLDRVASLLDYEPLRALVTLEGTYTVGMLTSCRHLDSRTKACRVFGTPERPAICTAYEATTCWWRAHFEAEPSEVVRLSAANWNGFVEQVGLEAGPLKLVSGPGSAGTRPTFLGFDIEDELGDAVDRQDMLRFLSNFDGLSLYRLDGAWHLVCKVMSRQGASMADEEELARVARQRGDEYVRAKTLAAECDRRSLV